jgi:hypothetical protein
MRIISPVESDAAQIRTPKVALFLQDETAISLAVHPLPDGAGRFVWYLVNRLVPQHNSQLGPVCSLDFVKVVVY